jgi:tetratricopeptide (TPR) repeat protein
MSLTVGEKMQRNAATVFHQLQRNATGMNAQYTIAGISLGIAGWFIGIKKRYPYAKSFLLLWLIAWPGFIMLANLPFDPQSDGILERFYILANIFWAYPLLIAVNEVLVKTKPALLFAAAGAAIVLLGAVRFDAINWRNYYLAYDYGRNILRTLAPGSIFFMDGGDDTFYSSAYFCFAEHRRADLELHDRGGLVFRSIYGSDFRMLSREEKEFRRQRIEAMYRGKRPLYFSTFNRMVMPGVAMEPDGFLYRPKEARMYNTLPMYAMRHVYDDDKNFDYRSRALVPLYPYFTALSKSMPMVDFWRYAYERWNDAIWIASNLKIEIATVAFEQYQAKNRACAKQLYDLLLSWYPNDSAALVNRGVLEKEEQHGELAMDYYRRAIAADPSNTEAYYNQFVLYWEKQQWQDAYDCLKKIEAIQPADERARHYLPIVADRIGGKRL